MRTAFAYRWTYHAGCDAAAWLGARRRSAGARCRALSLIGTVCVVLGSAGDSGSLAGAQHPGPRTLDIALWLDPGPEPVLMAGGEIRIYCRMSADAYVALFRLDTEGRVRMVFPRHPHVQPMLAGGRVFRLLAPTGNRWGVEDHAGGGAFFILASERPLDLSRLRLRPGQGWSLVGPEAPGEGEVERRIDEYAAALRTDADGEWAMARAAYQVVQRPTGPGVFRYLRPLLPRARPRPTLRRRPPPPDTLGYRRTPVRPHPRPSSGRQR